MRKQLVDYAVVAVASALLTTILQPWAHLPALARADTQFLAQTGCVEFKETGKRACGRFLQYWQQNGGLAQQGYPISNEFMERSELDGKEYLVQYYERAVFELHPENKAPYDVLLSQLGTFRYKEKYPNGEPGAPTPTPAPPPGVGVAVPIPPVEGLTASLDFNPKFERCLNENALTWHLRISNQGKVPANVKIDTSVSMRDSTSKTYQIPKTATCQANGTSGGFNEALTANGTSLNPGSAMTGYFRLAADDVPPTAAYLDFSVTINAVPVTFRYSVK